jgi:hypothetical protein
MNADDFRVGCSTATKTLARPSRMVIVYYLEGIPDTPAIQDS